MVIPLDWTNVFYLFAQFIGYLVGFALIISGLRAKKSNIFLGLNFLILTYSSFIVWLITTGYFVEFPRLYRTGNFTGMLFIPLMFLYIRHEVSKKPFTAWDLLHLLPAFVFLIDFWPVYQLPVEEKFRLIRAEIKDPTLFTRFSQSRFFPAGFYTPFRWILTLCYWCLSVYWVRVGARNSANWKFAKEWFIWIIIFLGFQSLVFLPALLLYWVIQPITVYYLAHISIVILDLGTGLSLLFFPKILYGLDRDLYEKQREKRSSKQDRFEQLTEAKRAEIGTKIELVLHREKKYLQLGYTVNDLAKDTGIPGYLLTLYINKVLMTSFPEMINRERVEECCRLMTSESYAHLGTDGFAELCGFSNRNTFIAAFRKYKEITPSAYLKSVKSKT